MISPDIIASYFKRNHYVLQRQVEGLTHEDSLLTPPFRANCLNWVLGHIVVYRSRALALLDAGPIWSDEQANPYKQESDPLPAQDARPLEQIMADLDVTQERLDAALADLTAEDLERVVDDRTLAQRLTFSYWHEAYHTGQTELLRQLAGMDDKII